MQSLTGFCHKILCVDLELFHDIMRLCIRLLYNGIGKNKRA